MVKYKLEITPAIEVSKRHKLQDCLKALGFNVTGGGTHTDLSACDITFEDDEEEADASKE